MAYIFDVFYYVQLKRHQFAPHIAPLLGYACYKLLASSFSLSAFSFLIWASVLKLDLLCFVTKPVLECII